MGIVLVFKGKVKITKGKRVRKAGSGFGPKRWCQWQRKTRMLKSHVRHRSRATSSRQPRQVRKEATVTGSCVCSGSPVP